MRTSKTWPNEPARGGKHGQLSSRSFWVLAAGRLPSGAAALTFAHDAVHGDVPRAERLPLGGIGADDQPCAGRGKRAARAVRPEH